MARVVQVLLLAASFFLFLAGGRNYDGLTFLGLRQLKKRSSCLGLTETCGLDTREILGVVRHPAKGIDVIPLSMAQIKVERLGLAASHRHGSTG